MQISYAIFNPWSSCDANTRKRATKSSQKRGNAYLYVVKWPSPAYEGRFGAVHGVDLALLFGNPHNLIAGNNFSHRSPEHPGRRWNIAIPLCRSYYYL